MSDLSGLKVGDKITWDEDYGTFQEPKRLVYPIARIGKKYVVVRRRVRHASGVREFDDHFDISTGRRRGSNMWHSTYAEPFKQE